MTSNLHKLLKNFNILTWNVILLFGVQEENRKQKSNGWGDKKPKNNAFIKL